VQALSTWASLHLVLDLGGGSNESGQPNPYPFNIMRNAAASWPLSIVNGVEPHKRLAAQQRAQGRLTEAGQPEVPGAAVAEVQATNDNAELGSIVTLPSPTHVLLIDVDSLLSTNAAALSLLLAHHTRVARSDGAEITKQKLKWVIQAMEVHPQAQLPSRPNGSTPQALEVEAEVLASMGAAIARQKRPGQTNDPQHTQSDAVSRLVDCVADSLPRSSGDALRNATAIRLAPAHFRPAVYMEGDTIQALRENHTIDIFHMRDYRSAYGGLMNISRWTPRRWCSPPQRTRYTMGFEPYAILPWPIVPFDERFHGHGFSKSAWWFDRCADGSCDLRALSEVFILSRLSSDFNKQGVLEHSLQRNRPENSAIFRTKVQAQRERGYSCQHYGLCRYVGTDPENTEKLGSGSMGTHTDPNATPGSIQEQHFHVGAAAGRDSAASPNPRPQHPAPSARVHRSPQMAQRLQQLKDAAMHE